MRRLHIPKIRYPRGARFYAVSRYRLRARKIFRRREIDGRQCYSVIVCTVG
jgi:hypothetical protein